MSIAVLDAKDRTGRTVGDKERTGLAIDGKAHRIGANGDPGGM
ncbi:MAG: hypothetical protein AB7T06_36380 [Kofleriaceae bacterium]